MNKIEFHKTSNIFINTGIIGLYRYLAKYKRINESSDNYTFRLETDRLILGGKNLLELLEEVYYLMGKDIYDTPSKEQLNKFENAYYDVKSNKFYRFPKMNTYGLTELLTNNAQGTTRFEENSTKIKTLEKEKPELADKIKEYFSSNKLKLLSKVYLNEPYTKLTRLKLENKYWETGDNRCPIIGESFKYLEDGINVSPFFSGLQNFNSFLNTSDVKISQKAIFLARFSPALVMYNYYNGREALICSFFNSETLTHINDLYSEELYYEKNEMQDWKFPFKRNIKLHSFHYSKKDEENFKIDSGEDSYSTEEITFLILLTFYKSRIQETLISKNKESDIDVMKLLGIKDTPISLVSFKAEKFASTMRPNFYEEYTNTKYILKLIDRLETHDVKRVPIKEIWRGLILKSDDTEVIKDYNKRKRLERSIRIEIIGDLLKGKSILTPMVSLYYKSYLRLTKNESAGFRRYDLLLQFLTIYESTLKFNNMDKELQQRAINLGKSMGQAILNFDSPKSDSEKQANAKNGRKYLIGIHKARTIEQFRDNLIRIQTKYGVSIANDILENMNNQNYIAIKQYAQMGALNSLNSILSNKKQ